MHPRKQILWLAVFAIMAGVAVGGTGVGVGSGTGVGVGSEPHAAAAMRASMLTITSASFLISVLPRTRTGRARPYRKVACTLPPWNTNVKRSRKDVYKCRLSPP